MHRRVRNTLLFVGSLLGAALLVLGLVALGDGDRRGWACLVGAVFAFALTFAPGLRLRDRFWPPGD
jgi:hypothetical protein